MILYFCNDANTENWSQETQIYPGKLLTTWYKSL